MKPKTWLEVWEEDPITSMGTGSLSGLGSGKRAKPLRREYKGPKVRMGYHPPEMAYEQTTEHKVKRRGGAASGRKGKAGRPAPRKR